jgi:TPR repeat protein
MARCDLPPITTPSRCCLLGAAEAAKWYRLAAEQGIADAAYDLGLMYMLAEGLPQDYPEAIKWPH